MVSPYLLSDLDWEKLWAPYDEATYLAVLQNICPEDSICDIGAGDLRLAYRMAKIAKRVYAIEIQETLIRKGLVSFPGPHPANLIILQGDARSLAFPPGITVGVLLMRHCIHFQLYAEKLKASGCTKMITNARWRSGLEVISLQERRINYNEVVMGWYACWCGSTGFKPGPAGQLTPEMEAITHEVIHCPRCLDRHAVTGRRLLRTDRIAAMRSQ